MHTFVIAEAAATHDGDLTNALRLVDLARAIRADAVKFQWLSSPERLVERRRAPEYLDAYRLLAFPREWFPTLVARCSEPRDDSPWATDPPGVVHQIPPVEFMCTAYLPEDVAVVAPYVTRFKVASFEADDQGIIEAISVFNKPVIVSTGMQRRGEARARWLPYMSVRRLALLHCVSAYPASLDEMNLAVLRDEDGEYAGLSDHSRHPWTGALAVAAGAEIIEFHVRLADTDPANADYAVARTPKEALEYIQHIRLAATMMGDGVKRVMPSEEALMKYRVRA